MNVNCSTCLELLGAGDDLSCPPCGHVFHTACIEQCIENTKKCPLCRSTIRSNGLRRIFLTQGADGATQADSSVLQNRVDQLTFDKRMLETEKKKAVEGCQKAEVQAVALREEVRDLEAKLSYAKEETQSCRAQTSLMMGEKKKADRAKREAEELREKLALFKNIEFVVNGSSAEVNQKMHQMGDYSKTSKDLTYMIVTLRKELDAKGKETSQYRKESANRQTKLTEVRASLEMVKQSNDSLSSDKAQLTEDNRHLEEEVGHLKAKLASLQDAISSPSGDLKQSVINRLVSEYPAPRVMSDLELDTVPSGGGGQDSKKRRLVDSPNSSGFGDILQLKKAKSFDPLKDSTNFNFNKKPLKTVSLSQQPQQSKKTNLLLRDVPKFRDLDTGLSPPTLGRSAGMDYDGFGGRSRSDADVFPSGFGGGGGGKKTNFKINGGANSNKSRKPKGVSRPKQNAPLASSASSKSIDQFFSALESS